jgi:hypothetical protein
VDDQTRQDSDWQDEQDAIVGNVNVRINAAVKGDGTESGQIARAKVFDEEYKEIAVVVKVNDTDTTAIIDTGSPVTVISRGLFDRMGNEYEDNQQKVKSNLKNSSIKLFSCEADQVMKTMGECNVIIKHKEFQCLSPVIIAVDLAHDCLIGMNVLVMWPTMKNAIDVLMKARIGEEDNDSRFKSDSTATRLNNDNILYQEYCQTSTSG